jgi:3',5'-cyclic AMP phosphodiesterase CpdA
MLLAHITDLHLNGSRERFLRTQDALYRARRMGAGYLVVTGDLTASGKPHQFQELASALDAWGSKYTVTIVPGNHDGHPRNFAGALRGPLKDYARASTPGSSVEIGGVARVLAISTQFVDRALAFRALGNVGPEQLRLLSHLAAQAVVTGKTLIVAMHHGPHARALGFFEGLTDRHEVMQLLYNRSRVAILAGHDHQVLNLGNIHVAGSIATHQSDPLRIYEVDVGGLRPVYQRPDEGRLLQIAGLPERSGP